MQPPESTLRGEKPTVSVVLDEYNHNNRAVVYLRWHGSAIVGRGLSRLDVGDEVEQPIGQKLALARAMSHLVRQLFTDAARDIEAASALRSA